MVRSRLQIVELFSEMGTLEEEAWCLIMSIGLSGAQWGVGTWIEDQPPVDSI